MDLFFSSINDKYEESKIEKYISPSIDMDPFFSNISNINDKNEESKNKNKEDKEDKNKKILEKSLAVLRGLVERLVLFIGLSNDLQQTLTLFGALKLGMRLSSEKEHRVSNDYFWIGNITSVLIAILYYSLWRKILFYSDSIILLEIKDILNLNILNIIVILLFSLIIFYFIAKILYFKLKNN